MLLLCKIPTHFGHALHLDAPSSITLWIWQVTWVFYSPARWLAVWTSTKMQQWSAFVSAVLLSPPTKIPMVIQPQEQAKGLALSEIQNTRNYTTARWRQLDVASTSGHEQNVEATSTSAKCLMESRRRRRRRHRLKWSHQVVCNYCHRIQQLPQGFAQQLIKYSSRKMTSGHRTTA